MRRLIPVLAIALAGLTVPATAQTTTEPVACPAAPEGTTVVGPNYSATPKIASPLPTASVTLKYLLDLSPATAEKKASVGAYLEWELRGSDWDLYLLDAEGKNLAVSERGQPVHPAGSTSTPPRPSDPYENVFRLDMAHCSVFQVRVTNASAPAGEAFDTVDPLQLEIKTGATR